MATTTTDGESVNPSPKPIKNIVSSSSKADESITDGITAPKFENMYEIHILSDDTELVYFGVEKLDAQNKSQTTLNDTDKGSSIGSVSSMTEPFALPTRSATITSSNSTLSTSSLFASSKFTKSKELITGKVELCDFMIEYFQKIRRNLVDDNNVIPNIETTPASTGRGRGRSGQTTPSPAPATNKRKRGAPLALSEPEEEQKSAKKIRKEIAATTPSTTTAATSVAATSSPNVSSNYPEKAVLARWVDKKFYPGKVIEQKANNKYVVLFEDGAKKVLPEDHIVFGEENILPLINEIVHALVKDETYEPGVVQSVEIKEDGTYYTILCESTTVNVTSSGIYLEEDQAKVILSKRMGTLEKQPEAGYSGGVNTRKDRRQKRYS